MRDDDLKNVVSDYQGRRFIADFFMAAGLFRQSYRSDEQTMFREGQRSLALKISAKLFTIDPKYFTMIIEEWQEREKHDRLRNENNR